MRRFSVRCFPRTIALAAAGALLLGAPVLGYADTITRVEDFEADFPAWESGWLGSNSNLTNYYVEQLGRPNSYRGNNPDGLWIADGLAGSQPVITFLPDFGGSLTSLSLDVAGWVATHIVIFDSVGSTLLDVAVALTMGSYTDPGTYANYSVTSATGIGGFSFSSTSAEGNTSIDNVVVTQAIVEPVSVPEPARLLLIGVGLLGLVTWRKSRCYRSSSR